MDHPVQSSHQHRFKPDTVLTGEEICDCGYWRCKYTDKTTRQKCPNAALGCKDYCQGHHKTKDRKNQLIEASGDAGKRHRQPHTTQVQPPNTPKDVTKKS